METPISETRLIEVVRHVARRYYVAGMDEDDLVQEGVAAAWNGLKDWDANGGRTVESWARFCAERGIVTSLKAAQR